MFVRVWSFTLQGIEALPVAVEVDVSPGLPSFEIVGLPDAAVREARERVRAAVRNGGWPFPLQRITVNLAPAHTRKEGAGFDLAIALGVLAAAGAFHPSALAGIAVAGELALDGGVRPVRGALAMAMALEPGRRLVLPPESAREAAACGADVLAAPHLADLRGTGPGGAGPGAARGRWLRRGRRPRPGARPAGGPARPGGGRRRGSQPVHGRPAGRRQEPAGPLPAHDPAAAGRGRGAGGEPHPQRGRGTGAGRSSSPAAVPGAPSLHLPGRHAGRRESPPARGGDAGPPRCALPGRDARVPARRAGGPQAAAGGRRRAGGAG
ncbi:hypothetical protein H9Q17_15950, partial [Symbiobacterium thermophilum]